MKSKFKKFLKRTLLSSPTVVGYAKDIAQTALTEDVFVRIRPQSLFKNLRFEEFLARADPKKHRYILTDCDVPSSVAPNVKKVITSVDGLTPEEISNSIFYIYFTCDSDALPELRKIKQHGGQFVPHFEASKTSYRFVNRLAHESMKRRWAKGGNLAHLSSVAIVHENLCEALELTKNVEGDFDEIGVFQGSSAITAMNYIQEQHKTEGIPKRKAWLIDTFDGFNYPEAKESADIFWAEYARSFWRGGDQEGHRRCCRGHWCSV